MVGIDLADAAGNVRDGNVASAGGTWMALVNGFGGMRERMVFSGSGRDFKSDEAPGLQGTLQGVHAGGGYHGAGRRVRVGGGTA